jgi:hypothetical protein
MLVIGGLISHPHNFGTTLTTDKMSSRIHIFFNDPVRPTTSTSMYPYTLLCLFKIF